MLIEIDFLKTQTMQLLRVCVERIRLLILREARHVMLRTSQRMCGSNTHRNKSHYSAIFFSVNLRQRRKRKAAVWPQVPRKHPKTIGSCGMRIPLIRPSIPELRVDFLKDPFDLLFDLFSFPRTVPEKDPATTNSQGS